jgi:NADH-quinone oxidoreductase subunit C
MSSDAKSGHLEMRRSLQPGLCSDDVVRVLAERFPLTRDPASLSRLTLLCPAEQLRAVVGVLRNDPRLCFDQLLDVVGIDYLSYPDHQGPRFAVVYVFKSQVFRHRVALKIAVDEDAPAIPSLHGIYLSADWAEREVWDQYGIVFTGHPNLKRLLNHHEFVGHPLRKDYPCQKRQKLSLNDPMVDQLEARLAERGYTVIERGEMIRTSPLTDAAGGAS